jgi:starch-binding outer membrane protein, SusD/RagB family
MNNNKLLSLLILGALLQLTCSCKKFLKEYSQDEMRPSTIGDLNSIMYSDAYPYNGVYDPYIDLLTDDIQSNGLQLQSYTSAYTNGTRIFQFDTKMFDGVPVIPSGSNSWSTYYAKIKGCNVVLDYLDKVSGDESEKLNTKAQAIALRAYYYLKLVNLYSQPFNRVDIDTNKSLGVPLILNMVVSDDYQGRNTLAECYHQIENDFLTADSLFTLYPTKNSAYRIGSVATEGLISRMYLYRDQKDDWDKVIQYTNAALLQKSELTNLAGASYVGAYGTYPILDPTNSTEVIWTFGSNQTTSVSNYYPSLTYGGMPPFSVSNDLSTLYDHNENPSNYGDLRYFFYLSMTNLSGTSSFYYSGKLTGNSTNGLYGIRTSELYLNRAEAYLNKYKLEHNSIYIQHALADINIVRKARFDTRNEEYQPIDLQDFEALFSFYQAERRRELCFEEDHRWCDIRRWGLSVKHVFIDASNQQTSYTLSSNSNGYALQIPYDAIAANYKLTQNPR